MIVRYQSFGLFCLLGYYQALIMLDHAVVPKVRVRTPQRSQGTDLGRPSLFQEIKNINVDTVFNTIIHLKQ